MVRRQARVLAFCITGLCLGPARATESADHPAPAQVSSAHPTAHPTEGSQGSASEEKERVRVIVPLVTLTGLPTEAAPVFTDALSEGIARSDGYEVVSHTTIVQILGIEAQRQLLGCSDQSCMAQIAGALNAERMVRGTVYHFGETTNLIVTLVDVTAGKNLAQRSAQTTAPERIPDLLRVLGAEVAGAKPLRTWQLGAGLITPPRWRIEIFGGARGLGAHYRMRLDASIPRDMAVDESLRQKADGIGAYAFDLGENTSWSGGFGLRRALLPWLEVGLRLGYARWRGTISDYPNELVALEQVTSAPSAADDTFKSVGPITIGCPLRYRSDGSGELDTNAAWSDENGTVAGRNNTKLADVPPDPKRDPDAKHGLIPSIAPEHSAYLPYLYGQTVPEHTGVCGLESNLFEADLVLGFQTHILSWLVLGLDARLGYSAGSYDWGGGGRGHINAWRAGGMGRLLVEWGRLLDGVPDTLALGLGFGLATQGSFDRPPKARIEAAQVRHLDPSLIGSTKKADEVEGIDTDATSPMALWGLLLRFEVGLSYAF